MSAIPIVTATLDKASYVQGETVTVTFTVDADTRPVTVERNVSFTGHDDEGNEVTASVLAHVVVQVADSFTLDSVAWADTGVAFAVVGLQATGVA